MNSTYSRGLAGKHVSDIFSFRNGFKYKNVLGNLFSNPFVDYALRRVRVNQDFLKLTF